MFSGALLKLILSMFDMWSLIGILWRVASRNVERIDTRRGDCYVVQTKAKYLDLGFESLIFQLALIPKVLSFRPPRWFIQTTYLLHAWNWGKLFNNNYVPNLHNVWVFCLLSQKICFLVVCAGPILMVWGTELSLSAATETQVWLIRGTAMYLHRCVMHRLMHNHLNNDTERVVE